MRKVREVLRLHALGLSNRGIGHSLGVHAKTVQGVLERAERACIGWPVAEGMTEAALEERLYPAPCTGAQRPEPDVRYLHEELRKRGVTLELLWREYRQEHPDGFGYTQFCGRYRRFKKSLDLTMRKVHRAGEAVEIDYSGMTVPYQDRATGRVHQAQVFVAQLCASSYIFADVTTSQGEEDFLSSQARMFEAFGGVTRMVIPDNLKAGVTRPDRYEPKIPRAYEEFAAHYNVAITPARPLHPQDKGGTESAVAQVERWVLAPLRKCVFFDLASIKAAMLPLMEEVNRRPLVGLGVSRFDLLERLDRPSLRPLPERRFGYGRWVSAQKVGRDYHVRFEGRFYSVPSHLYGERVELRVTRGAVEVFHRGERVSSHPRLFASDPRRGITQEAHMPKGHRAQAQLATWDQVRFERWAERVGPFTRALVVGVFARRHVPEQGYGACQGILHAASGVPAETAEAAARRCVNGGMFTARVFRAVVRELGEKDVAEKEPPPIIHENVRGAGYYAKKE